MKKINRLSHSAIDTYNTCSEKYKLKYIERIRPTTKTSALVFGDSVDKAINRMLEGKDTYLEAFNDAWSYNKIGDDIEESISDNINMRYYASDYDPELVKDEDNLLLSLKADELGLPQDIDIIALKKERGYDNMTEEEIRLFNLTNWLCLRNKAPYMLEAYKKHVLPRIKKTHNIQKEIKLENDDGDTVIGFADLDIDYEHTDGKIYRTIADNKTSSIQYKEDSVAKSQQLGIYCISENIKHAVYFVINKKMKKNRTKKCTICGHNGKKLDNSLTRADCCDNVVLSRRCKGKWEEDYTLEAKIDIIFDEITQEQRDKVLETIQQTNQDIKDEKFEKNFKACGNYGGCEYAGLCHQGSMKNLKKKD